MAKLKHDPNLQPKLITEAKAEYQITPEEQTEKECYRQRLAEYLKDPEFRQIEGFPIGEDEAILALSDPPYYTACPNPFLGEIIERWQKERAEQRQVLNLPDDSQENEIKIYHREPFASDVSEGKNDPIYNAHSYHTKVPHKAIMRYILHYTDPDDIIFDGFCGTGMTGVAAQLCGDRKAVESLGYKVQKDGRVQDEKGQIISRFGARKAVLVDLSPAATFISYNYNTPVNVHIFEREARRILKEVEQECGWMYETWHPSIDHPTRIKGKINFTVWSDVFVCSYCSNELIFWDVALDQTTGSLVESWDCPYCGTKLAKNPSKNSGAIKVTRSFETFFNPIQGRTLQRTKQVPVLINYTIDNKRFVKRPDEHDLAQLKNIEHKITSYWFPRTRIDRDIDLWYERDYRQLGVYSVDAFYFKRSLILLSTLCNRVHKIEDSRIRGYLLWLFTSILEGSSKMNRERPGGMPSKLSGTLYIGALIREINIIGFMSRKINKLSEIKRQEISSLISNQSSNRLPQLAPNSIDYIFTDPPFGSNIIYSDLSILWEAWLDLFTSTSQEAVIHRRKKENATTLDDYQELMVKGFMEMYRALKHGRWVTVEFHNTQNSVWNAIQEAVLRAGFMVADVRTLNKQQGSFKQVTTTAAVKQDLIISAYKPRSYFERQFQAEGGSIDGAWAFIRQHLEQLPLPTVENSVVETLSERQVYLLYDRMVAFHLVRDLNVPLSAPEFYKGLAQHFLERDGMYFTPAQATEYDKLRLKAERVEQLALFVTDEKSAVQWLRQALDPVSGGQPQTYQNLQPEFIQQLHQARHEKLPELREMLEENFLQDEAERWYNPNPDRQADLEALREKTLLREFSDYRKGKGRLRVFRSEAVRAGFSRAWRERDYNTILSVAERLPEQVLQEDPALKMYYDNAINRAARQPKQERLL